MIHVQVGEKDALEWYALLLQNRSNIGARFLAAFCQIAFDHKAFVCAMWVVNIGSVQTRINQIGAILMVLDDTHVDRNVYLFVFYTLSLLVRQIHDAGSGCPVDAG